MPESIIIALITGGLSLVGVYIANRKSQALIEYKIDELSKQVQRHNQVVERTFELERRADVLEEKIKVANNRIADLEHGGVA